MTKIISAGELETLSSSRLRALQYGRDALSSPIGTAKIENNLISAEILLTEHDVARRQKRSVKTIRNQRVLGDGIPFIKIGRLVRYRLRDIIAFENSCLRSSTGDKRCNDEL